MPTNAQILTLTQWLSPAYPVGAFAYSHGLEWAVETKSVHDARTLQDWLEDILRHGAGQSDALFLAAAYLAPTPQDISNIDQHCRAFAPSKERRQESDLQGAAFCAITAEVWSQEIQNLTYPVAVGRAAALAGLPLPLTQRMFTHAFLTTLVTAGLRLFPLGQTQGQRIIFALTPLIEDIAKAAQTGDLETLSGTAFLADIGSMRHETQYSRMFRT